MPDEQPFLEQLAEFFARQPLSQYGFPTTVGQMVTAALVLFAMLVVAFVWLQTLRRRRRKANEEPGAEQQPVKRASDRVLLITVFVVGTLVAMEAIGIEVRAALGVEVYPTSKGPVTVSTFVIALAFFGGSFVLSRLVQAFLDRTIHAPTPQAKANVRTVGRLVHYVIVLVGIAIALQQIGVDLTALVAVGGVLAIAIGFAMRNIAENFVSGVILLVERAIRPGDILEVEGRVVEVSTMGIRSTVVRTLDGEEMVVPNAILVSNPVKNYTLRDSMYRLRASVGVSYGSDMKQVFEVLEKVGAEFEHGLRSPPPQVQLTGFGDNSVNFDVCVWMNNPWGARQAISHLNRAIWFALMDAGIVIAFPQLDLHLDPEAYDALAGRRRASIDQPADGSDFGSDDDDRSQSR